MQRAAYGGAAAPRASLSPRESRGCTVLLILQLVIVGLFMSMHYPALLERLSLREKAGGSAIGGARGKGPKRRTVTTAAAPAEPPPPPSSVWAPRCQLPEDVQPSHGNKSYIDISVSSEFSARSRRDAIRAGYGAYANSLGLRVRFFCGEPEDAAGAAARAAEQAQFGDLVVLPMMDTYENLTLKSMGMAVYTAKCGNGDFYVKTDDDVFVYPWRLKRRLEKVAIDSIMWKTKLGVYMGNFWVDSRPIRETWHKNYEPKWKGEHYNAYAAGPFYILSRGAVEFVGNNALALNWKWKNEDMAMGTWMQGADVEFLNDWHIKILNWKHHEPPLIAEHCIDHREDPGIENWHLALAKNHSSPDLAELKWSDGLGRG